MAAPAAQSPRGKKDDARTNATGTDAAKPAQAATVHALPRPSLLTLRKAESPRARTAEPAGPTKPTGPRAEVKSAPKVVVADRESSLAALTLVAIERASLLLPKSRNAPPAPPRSPAPERAKATVTPRAKSRVMKSAAVNKHRYAADPTDYNVQIISAYETPPVPVASKVAMDDGAEGPASVSPPLPTANIVHEVVAHSSAVPQHSEISLTDEEAALLSRPVLPRGRVFAMGGLVLVAAAVALVLPMLTSKPAPAPEPNIVASAGAVAEPEKPVATAPSHTETALVKASAPEATKVEPQAKSETLSTHEKAAAGKQSDSQPLTAALIASPKVDREIAAPRANRTTAPTVTASSPRKHVGHRATVSKKKHVRSYYDVARKTSAKRRSHR